MKLISLALVVLGVSICHAQTQQNPTLGANNDLIDKTCSSTPYNDFCKTLLESSPKSKSAADLYGLAEIIMDMASDKVSKLYDALNQVQNSTDVDNFMDQCLTDCLESYEDAIDQVEDSVTALDFKAYNDINTWITAAMTDADTCDSSFKARPGYQSPIEKLSKDFDQTCSIILAMAKSLSEGKANVSS